MVLSWDLVWPVFETGRRPGGWDGEHRGLWPEMILEKRDRWNFLVPCGPESGVQDFYSECHGELSEGTGQCLLYFMYLLIAMEHVGYMGRGRRWLGYRWYSGDRRAYRWGSIKVEPTKLTDGSIGYVEVAEGLYSLLPKYTWTVRPGIWSIQ